MGLLSVSFLDELERNINIPIKPGSTLPPTSALHNPLSLSIPPIALLVTKSVMPQSFTPFECIFYSPHDPMIPHLLSIIADQNTELSPSHIFSRL